MRRSSISALLLPVTVLLSCFTTLPLVLVVNAEVDAVLATTTTTSTDTPLPYTLYTGGYSCSEEFEFGTGVTTSFSAIQDEFGSFCEVDEIDASGGNGTTAFYSKIVIASCDEEEEADVVGYHQASFYNCADDACTDCNSTAELTGYLSFNSSGIVPEPDDCFSVQKLTENDEDVNGMPVDAREIFSASAIYQLFDVATADGDSSAMSTDVEKYWNIMVENSCLGKGKGQEQEASNGDGDTEDGDDGDGTMMVSFVDAPLTYVDYGGDGCTESNEVFTGQTMKVSLMDDGTAFCEEDMITSNGTTFTAYSKIVYQCTPPNKDLPNEIYAIVSACNKTGCTECEADLTIGYVDWSFVTDDSTYTANTCLSYTFASAPSTMDEAANTAFTGFVNATKGYQVFDSTNSDEDITSYWNFYFDNSCVAEGKDSFVVVEDDNDDDEETSTASSADGEDQDEDEEDAITFGTFDQPLSYVEYGDGDGCTESNEVYTGQTTKVQLVEDGTAFCEEDVITSNGTTFTAYSKVVLQCTPPAEGLLDAIYATYYNCNNTGCTECEMTAIGYLDWSMVTDDSTYTADSCFMWTMAPSLSVPNSDDLSGIVFGVFENATKGYQKWDSSNTDEAVALYWHFYFDNSCVADGQPSNNTTTNNSSSSEEEGTDKDGGDDAPPPPVQDDPSTPDDSSSSGIGPTFAVLRLFDSYILLLVAVALLVGAMANL
jgi:hypothetical protein